MRFIMRLTKIQKETIFDVQSSFGIHSSKRSINALIEKGLVRLLPLIGYSLTKKGWDVMRELEEKEFKSV